MSSSVRNVTPVTVPVGERDNGKRGKTIGELCELIRDIHWFYPATTPI